jgi:protein O-GlcNAc transferase
MEEAERQRDQLAAGWNAIERDPRSAEEIARMALRGESPHIEFVRLLGASLFLQDRFQEAIEPFREVFQKARTAGAGYHLGHCHLAVGDPKTASAVLEQVVREFPQMVQAHNLLGISLAQQSRHREALAHFAFAMERSPRDAEAHNNMGNALSELGRYEEAISYFEKATELIPDDPQARNNLGNALFKLHRSDAAIATYRKAIDLAPDYAKAHSNLGAALVERNRYEEAVTSCQKALAIDPDHANAHINLGLAYHGLYRFDEAIVCYQKALAIAPESAEAHTNIGLTQQRQKRLEEAIASHRRAISLKPGLAHAHLNLAFTLQSLKLHEEAMDCFKRVLAIEPDHKYAIGGLLQSELASCRWDDFSARIGALEKLVREGSSVTEPFVLLAVSQNPEEQKLCAERFVADKVRWRPAPLWRGEQYRHPKIRVAYLSADFREHPVAYCIQELFGLHDRSRFEIFGVSFGADDGSEMRSRLMSSFDRSFDVRAKDDSQVAGLVRELEADIAIDLMGHTSESRPGIFALRPAPVQAAYLGFAGTTGSEFIDYLIADRFVIPEEDRRHYREQVVYLPDTFMVNHSNRLMAEPAPRRAQAGLPENGFVFCCLGNNYKITPEVFDVWMRLLQKVEDSVLWLSLDNPAVENNLRKESQIRGVDPARLIFAPFVKRIEEHYARYRLADLYLDTAYNGHVTTTDALWAGLPVLTRAGGSFAGRVAGSLLRAVGLPELVTHDLGEYEAMALKLARDRRFLESLRARLEENKHSAPLFDTDRFRRHIESAYRTMWEIWQRGDEPRAFAVESLE